MNRRLLSICIVLGLLLLSLFSWNAQTIAQAQAPTPTSTPGCNPPPQTPSTWVSSSATSVNTGDQVVVTVSTNVGAATFSLSVIDTATSLAQSQTDPIFNPARPTSQTPGNGVITVKWTLIAVRAGTVFFRGSASGEVQFCSGGHIGFTLGSASGNSVNVTVNGSPVTPVATLTPTATSTQGECCPPTLTPTRTNTPGTPTRTPTRTNLPPITNTPTRTPTPTSVTGVCSPITSTITAPFTFDGAGTFCWQSSNLGAYINSWNTTSVTINGVNVTNLYMASSSYPAKINGFWYVGYSSNVAWGHFEAK